eukprot:8639622-Pyramimonas_sp.AAC.1
MPPSGARRLQSLRPCPATAEAEPQSKSLLPHPLRPPNRRSWTGQGTQGARPRSRQPLQEGKTRLRRHQRRPMKIGRGEAVRAGVQ